MFKNIRATDYRSALIKDWVGWKIGWLTGWRGPDFFDPEDFTVIPAEAIDVVGDMIIQQGEAMIRQGELVKRLANVDFDSGEKQPG